MKQAPESPLPESAYSSEMTGKVYAEICAQSAAILAAGHTVIADAVFSQPAERAAVSAIARAKGVNFKGWWLQARASTLEPRLAKRVGDASEATAAILAQQLRYYIGPLEDWIRVDAEGDAAPTLAAARALLNPTEVPAGGPIPR